jgi:hypothetical protein
MEIADKGLFGGTVKLIGAAESLASRWGRRYPGLARMGFAK